jgi:hypothetical protein
MALCKRQRTILPASLCLALLVLGTAEAQPPPPPDGGKLPPPAKLGLSVNDPRAYQGYTLLAPMNSTKTYLLDMQGKVVRTWQSDCTPALGAYLLENGHLLRPGNANKAGPFAGPGPGAGGRIQEFTWDGKIVWDFTFSVPKLFPHHDICKLPNGNVLMIVGSRKTSEEALAAGRRPETVRKEGLQADCLVEIKPTGKTTGEVVWEWHVWDHLIQDQDKSKANYGDVAKHPELVDVNFGQQLVAQIVAKKGGADKLRTIGYLGGGQPGKGPPMLSTELTHFNSVVYNPALDQIMISVHSFSELWVIDHSTTRTEAAGHSGGRSGKGGDLLYRWGNPRAYRAKTGHQELFGQHHAHWIPPGLPGAGHILVFNNGMRRPSGSYSSVDEIIPPPVDAKGRYAYKPGTAYGPRKAVWSYSAPKKSDFFSMVISGVQRLPNGNTLICSGVPGILFEVTPKGETVWKYANPIRGERGPGGMQVRIGGPGGFGGPPRPGEILPGFLQGMLRLSPEQKKELEGLQKEVDAKLGKILTAAQQEQLKEMPRGFGFGGPGPGGNSVFRAFRYGPTYPGLAGRDLTPGPSAEELQKERKTR